MTDYYNDPGNWEWMQFMGFAVATPPAPPVHHCPPSIKGEIFDAMRNASTFEDWIGQTDQRLVNTACDMAWTRFKKELEALAAEQEETPSTDVSLVTSSSE